MTDCPQPDEAESDLVARERQMLDDVAQPFVRDVVRTLDPGFALSFEIDDSFWLCISHESNGAVSGRSICNAGEVADYIGSDHAWALSDIASKIADFAFGDVVGSWPRCPDHGDHPLHLDLRYGQAMWVCRHPGGGAKSRIGDLAG